MKTKSVLCIFAALLLLLGTPISAGAETAGSPEESEPLEGGRNIYVGDIITLEIKAAGISALELREKFSDFEIVELREGAGGYLLSLRTFEPGEYIVPLEDKKIVISVASTLEDIIRDDIFEGGTQVIESGFFFRWRILFYIAAGAFALSGGIILAKAVLKKKAKPLPPYEAFIRRSGALAAERDTYLVDLTRCFKEYLESLYGFRIIGKTSAEIVAELKKIEPLDIAIADIREWLAECDRLKFTGVEASGEKKQEHYRKLLELAGKVDSQRSDAQKEGVA